MCMCTSTTRPQVYPVETPPPPGLAAGITLRPYQKQSLAFMLDIERSTDPSLLGQPDELKKKRKRVAVAWVGGRPVYSSPDDAGSTHSVRGGWLCDEMGMRRTAVVSVRL